MRITRKEDYAVLILSVLANAKEKTLSASSLARTHHLPVAFVHQILRDLRRAGIVKSKEGVRGGYRLARLASHVKLADILEAMSGPTTLTRCANAGQCSLKSHCPTRSPWQTLQSLVHSLFSTITLEHIAQNRLRQHP